MAHLYRVYDTQVWYQGKKVRSFPNPKNTDRNLNFLGGGQYTNFVCRYIFSGFNWQCRSLTGSSDPLELFIILT